MNWFGINARLRAIFHKILHPTHKLIWRAGVEDVSDDFCRGDIVCDTCSRIYWCRWYDLSKKEQKERYVKMIKQKEKE